MAKGKYEEWLLPDNLLRIQGWARDGLTDEQIAKNMGIHRDTLNEWRKKYSVISDTLKKSKEVVDREVENALLKSAKGYDVIETVEELRFNKKTGEYELKVTKRTKRHIPPSQVAQIFWLKNRKPKEWRERQEYEVNLDALNKAADILGGIRDVIND
jgi:transcriptional regulator with XRE-family HTH domain